MLTTALLWIVYILPQPGKAIADEAPQCYSCMSANFGLRWGRLKVLFRKPLSFTDSCTTDILYRGFLSSKICPDMCVNLKINETTTEKQEIGNFRGCLSDVLQMNVSFAKGVILERPNSCVKIEINSFFGGNARGMIASTPGVDSSLFCVCDADNCNAGKNDYIFSGATAVYSRAEAALGFATLTFVIWNRFMS